MKAVYHGLVTVTVLVSPVLCRAAASGAVPFFQRQGWPGEYTQSEWVR